MNIRVNRFDICIQSYLPYILHSVMINVSKTGKTKSFSKTQLMVHCTE